MEREQIGSKNGMFLWQRKISSRYERDNGGADKKGCEDLDLRKGGIRGGRVVTKEC